MILPGRLRRPTGVLAALAVVACAAVPAVGTGEADRVRSIPIDGDGRRIGGLSAIHVYPGGMTFTALSDRAIRIDGTLLRDTSTGNLTGMRIDRAEGLIDYDGSPLGRFKGDSEGIAISPEGDVYISFEVVNRIRIEDRGDGLPERVAALPFIDSLQFNSGLEALAIGPDGSLYTVPERTDGAATPFPVWRLRDGTWDTAFVIPRREPFLAVGADIGPDGRFYLLERHFNRISFRSRLRRFDLDGSHEEVLFETASGVHGNLEGVSIWRDGAGALRATMVADDNFQFFQRNEIVEYVLPD